MAAKASLSDYLQSFAAPQDVARVTGNINPFRKTSVYSRCARRHAADGASFDRVETFSASHVSGHSSLIRAECILYVSTGNGSGMKVIDFKGPISIRSRNAIIDVLFDHIEPILVDPSTEVKVLSDANGDKHSLHLSNDVPAGLEDKDERYPFYPASLPPPQ